jgi:4-hydroxy-3-methylbut-2-enyl diphosphate reductase
MTERARKERSGSVTLLGPLVHNEQVVGRMRASGINTASHLEQVDEGTVVISAHGVSAGTLASVRARGLDIVDTTCPFVTKVHRAAKMLLEQGYQLLLVGDAGHTEVLGVMRSVEEMGGTVTLVSSACQVAEMELGKKVGIISQTTQRRATFAAIVAEVSRRAYDVRAICTVCGATDELQDAARELARRVDLVIVAGGQASANTRRLLQLCLAEGAAAYQVECADEIDPAWLAGHDRIGITAGASTPDWTIEEIARKINGGRLPENWQIAHPD